MPCALAPQPAGAQQRPAPAVHLKGRRGDLTQPEPEKPDRPIRAPARPREPPTEELAGVTSRRSSPLSESARPRQQLRCSDGRRHARLPRPPPSAVGRPRPQRRPGRPLLVLATCAAAAAASGSPSAGEEDVTEQTGSAAGRWRPAPRSKYGGAQRRGWQRAPAWQTRVAGQEAHARTHAHAHTHSGGDGGSAAAEKTQERRNQRTESRERAGAAQGAADRTRVRHSRRWKRRPGEICTPRPSLVSRPAGVVATGGSLCQELLCCSLPSKHEERCVNVRSGTHAASTASWSRIETRSSTSGVWCTGGSRRLASASTCASRLGGLGRSDGSAACVAVGT